MSPTTSSSRHADDAEILVQAYLPPPDDEPSSHTESLSPPLAIPQVTSDELQDATFPRSYNSAFEKFGLSQKVMVSFIEGLNLAMATSLPLRVVGASSTIVGYLPYNWAKLPLTSVHHEEHHKTYTLAKSVTDHYLRIANIQVFKPRRLVARLCTTSALILLFAPQKPEENLKPLKKVVSRGALSVARNWPITGLITRHVGKKDTKNAAKDDVYSPIAKRRMALIEGRTLPLSTSGKPPQTPSSVISILPHYGVSAHGIRSPERKAEEEQLAAQRFQTAGVTSQGSFNANHPGVRAMERAARRRREIGGTARQIHLETPQGPEGEFLKNWAVDKLLWLVIMDESKDMDIEDINMAENPEHEEHLKLTAMIGELAFESEEMADGN
ncbi:hypothetical protein BDP27DRAFT_583683 [Rhodocollybia butyracea]|uniref:Uncharacterized protein n=1 Tax=Rhodocollybia butyracea TaxID=206335 RepID=A0A9P5PWJ6_9AGAR|nr:hypothetical protein BDP27DRAFT_583683 [Rhodocollybia butyracea]